MNLNNFRSQRCYDVNWVTLTAPVEALRPKSYSRGTECTSDALSAPPLVICRSYTLRRGDDDHDG
jgi:hypothetical protein